MNADEEMQSLQSPIRKQVRTSRLLQCRVQTNPQDGLHEKLHARLQAQAETAAWHTELQRFAHCQSERAGTCAFRIDS